MGHDLYEQSAEAREIFDRADSILGYPISRTCFEGPEDALMGTRMAQPAIFTVSYACLEAARNASIIDTPAFCAGHSLGEYTAIVAAGALEFEQGLKLVRERGRLMQKAADTNPGTMAAILGLDEEVVAAVCSESGTELCNVNAPGQIVVGGAVDAVERATALAVERGARRAVLLKVGGAFHTSLMQPAVKGMKAAITDTPFRDADVPVIANTSGEPVRAAEDIRTELVDQIARPVQWQGSVEYLASQGVEAVTEFGPGKVLTSLVKRIDSSIELRNVSTAADLVHA